MELRKHPFFRLDCDVKGGKGLIAMDRGGEHSLVPRNIELVPCPIVKMTVAGTSFFLERVHFYYSKESLVKDAFWDGGC